MTLYSFTLQRRCGAEPEKLLNAIRGAVGTSGFSFSGQKVQGLRYNIRFQGPRASCRVIIPNPPQGLELKDLEPKRDRGFNVTRVCIFWRCLGFTV